MRRHLASLFAAAVAAGAIVAAFGCGGEESEPSPDAQTDATPLRPRPGGYCAHDTGEVSDDAAVTFQPDAKFPAYDWCNNQAAPDDVCTYAPYLTYGPNMIGGYFCCEMKHVCKAPGTDHPFYCGDTIQGPFCSAGAAAFPACDAGLGQPCW